MQRTESRTKQATLTDRPQSEERYQAFIRNSSEGIWRLELDEPISIKLSAKEQVRRLIKYAYIAEANLATAKMYGFQSADSVIGLRMGDLVFVKDPDVINYFIEFVTHGYNISGVESNELDKDGNDKYFRNNLTGIVENGYLVRAWGTQQDITEKRQASEALKRSEERLNLALQASAVGLWELDLKRGTLYWSDELKAQFAVPLTETVDYDKYIQLIHPDDREWVQELVGKHIASGKPYQFEHRIIWPDGSLHWLLGSGQAFHLNGEPVRMIGTCANIDDRKHAEEAARRQNSFLELLHDSAVEATQSMGRQSDLLESILNHARTICDTPHGYVYLRSDTQDELEVKFATGMFKEHIGHTIKKGVGLAGRVWKTNAPLVVTDYDKWPLRQPGFPKGFFKAGVGVPLRTGGKTIGILVMAHDSPEKSFDDEQLTTLQRLCDLASISLTNAQLFGKLQESEQRFRSMADNAPIFIWLSGLDKRVTYLNKAWLDFTGHTMGQEAGDGWMEAVYPPDRDLCKKSYVMAFDIRQPYSIEFRIRRFDGVYRWILSKGIPRFSPSGDFEGFIGSGIDIDDMRRANDLVMANVQLKNQRAQLMAVNKTKDEFIALASHQLRTPATAVKQYTSLLIQEFAGPLNAAQLKYLRIAFESNERQLQIINDLLKTAQIDSSRYVLDKKLQDIAKVIKQAARELRATCELKNQKITLVGLKSTMVEVDGNEMKLVFINLLENASKYSYPDTEIIFTMRATDKRLEFTVTDVGVGVSQSDSRRIFDKFTRVDNELSDTVTGTGFGLYWVKRIVKLHGGTIKVESEIGHGSKFIVRLPR